MFINVAVGIDIVRMSSIVVCVLYPLSSIMQPRPSQIPIGSTDNVSSCPDFIIPSIDDSFKVKSQVAVEQGLVKPIKQDNHCIDAILGKNLTKAVDKVSSSVKNALALFAKVGQAIRKPHLAEIGVCSDVESDLLKEWDTIEMVVHCSYFYI